MHAVLLHPGRTMMLNDAPRTGTSSRATACHADTPASDIQSLPHLVHTPRCMKPAPMHHRLQVSAVVPLLRLLLPNSALLFYCHYPDLLLAPSAAVTAAVRAEAAAKPTGATTTAANNRKAAPAASEAAAPLPRLSLKQRAVRLYRAPLDWFEEYGTGAASLVLVNSRFTARVFASTFTRLAARCDEWLACHVRCSNSRRSIAPGRISACAMHHACMDHALTPPTFLCTAGACIRTCCTRAWHCQVGCHRHRHRQHTLRNGLFCVGDSYCKRRRGQRYACANECMPSYARRRQGHGGGGHAMHGLSLNALQCSR